MANKYAVAAGNFASSSTWSNSPAGAAGATPPVAGDNAYANGFAVTIAANATCAKISNQAENGATSGGSFTISAGVTLTANVQAGSTANAHCLLVTFASPNTCTINGDIIGGSAASVYGLSISGSGIVNVNGNVNGGTSGVGIFTSSTANLTVTGNVNANQLGFTGIYFSSATITAVINGNLYGSTTASQNAIYFPGLAGSTLTINGNIYALNAAAALIQGANNATTITVNGDVFGGNTASNCFALGTNNVLNLNGNVYAGNVGTAVVNNQTGTTVNIKRVVGNGYGLGGSNAISNVYAVSSTNTAGPTYIKELEIGPNGHFPILGPVILTDVVSNVAVVRKSSSSTKTLIDTGAISNALPTANNVRSGVVYNSGATTGTCAVPAASLVVSGVPVDATVGTALLTQSGCWGELTSTMTSSGSIGERVKSVSTVSTDGQQIANSLSA